MYYGYYYKSYYELYHHGTKGMRWGVRKYQNPDGSLTPAGKERYSQRSKKTEWTNEIKRRKKLSFGEAEKELADRVFIDENDEEHGFDSYMTVWKEIREHSGDYYEQKGVSEGFKSLVKRRQVVEALQRAEISKIPEPHETDSESSRRAFKKWLAEREQYFDAVREVELRPEFLAMKPTKDEYVDVALSDLGYPITDRTRELLRDLVLID